MPEVSASDAGGGVGHGATGDPRDDAGAGAAANEATAPPAAGEHRVFYVLGLGVQTLLWFLLFLAIVVAVAVGGELTEFRYVGF